jgi:hypothetical protein
MDDSIINLNARYNVLWFGLVGICNFLMGHHLPVHKNVILFITNVIKDHL